MLVVLIVIALLAAMALSAYLGYRDRAHDATAQENIHRLAPSISAYFVDHDSYSGMTIANLTATYDSAVDPALFSLGSVAPTQSTYCVQSTSSERTWRKNGPTAALEPQSCP